MLTYHCYIPDLIPFSYLKIMENFPFSINGEFSRKLYSGSKTSLTQEFSSTSYLLCPWTIQLWCQIIVNHHNYSILSGSTCSIHGFTVFSFKVCFNDVSLLRPLGERWSKIILNK